MSKNSPTSAFKNEMLEQFVLHPIGVVRSTLKNIEDCPLQGTEGAPEAWLDIASAFTNAIQDIEVGNSLILLTWFHHADRKILKCIRRKEYDSPEVGVFSTRSPDRPNPIGLHRVKVLEISSDHIKVFPLEALDGTPLIDIKPVLENE